jgi:hypothetical protein
MSLAAPRGFRRAFRRLCRRPADRNYRPRLEALESRLAPSVNVLTYHNDNSSTGRNVAETILTPANVNFKTFGVLFRTKVDGNIYAEPIFESGVNITVGPSRGTHNVTFVATEHDSLYAIDADNGHILWHDSFINPSAGITPVPATDTGSGAIIPEVGITGTPVIDPMTNTLFLDANTKEVHGGSTHYVHRLHAIDVTSGAEKFGGPATIADTIKHGANFTYVSGPFVFGKGSGSIGGKITFNALRQLQRPALTLSHGVVYLAYGSHDDIDPYHGWVLGYSAQTLKLVGVFNATPNGDKGGIWMSGGRIAADAQGNLYLVTADGPFDSNLDSNGFPQDGDYGDSVLKLAVDRTTGPNNQNKNGWGLKVVDYFTPFDQSQLDIHNKDFGSGGPLLLPDSVGSPAHPHLLIVGGKDGRLYLIDRDKMGKFDPNTDHVVERLSGSAEYFGTAAYLNGMFYSVAVGEVGKAFKIHGASFNPTPASHTADACGYPGATPSISSNAALDGIVWSTVYLTDQLRAYDARDYGKELYTSAQAPGGRDDLGHVIKFTVPTIADGRVYVGTLSHLVVYGLLPKGPATQTSLPSAAVILPNFAGTALSSHFDNSPSVGMSEQPATGERLEASDKMRASAGHEDESRKTPAADRPARVHLTARDLATIDSAFSSDAAGLLSFTP